TARMVKSEDDPTFRIESSLKTIRVRPAAPVLTRSPSATESCTLSGSVFEPRLTSTRGTSRLTCPTAAAAAAVGIAASPATNVTHTISMPEFYSGFGADGLQRVYMLLPFAQ